MTFKDNNGRELLFDGDFALTKQSVSLFSGSIKGDVSITFRVDNNSINRETLNYKGPQMTNQVAFTRQQFSRVRNGNILDTGYIVIQSESEDRQYLNCFYISGNSNWIQLLNGLITELDYSGKTNGKDYVKQFTYVGAGNSFVPSTEGITFPFIDWCFNKKKGTLQYRRAPLPIVCLVDIKGDVLQPLIEFYPCFYMHSLVNEIFNQNGIKKEGNIFQDALYKSLALTPSEGLIKRSIFKKISLSGTSQTYTGGFGVYTKITGLTARQSDPDLWNDNLKVFTPDVHCLVNVSATRTAGTATATVLWLYKNGVRTSSVSITSVGLKKTLSIALLSTDTLELYIEGFPTNPFDAAVDIEIEMPEVILGGDYINPSDFLPSIKSIDIVKFLVNFFGCAVYFDSISKTITLTIIEKLKLEDAYDWSDYYVSHSSNYTENAAHNFINWNQASDAAITKYNQDHTLNFADGDLTTDNALLDQKKICDFPFAPSASHLGYNGIYCLDIPLINLVDDGEPIPFTSIASTATFTSKFTTGLPSVIKDNEVVRITNSAGLNIGYYYGTGSVGADFEDLQFEFTSTDTGKIYRQRINYQKITPRVISVKSNTPITEYSLQAQILGESFQVLSTNFDYATFTKSKTGFPIDNWKNNLAIDNPDTGNFTDPTIKEVYLNKISRFIKNPGIRATMRIPEAVYHRFKFDQFIYLKTDITGYFFVYSIENYVDGNTPVEVNLYML
jgi:hypothetical protein